MNDVNTTCLLLGNEALGRGLVEAGCHFVTSYPGTPSSEILPAVVKYKKETGRNIYTHWAVNEKVAFDEALAAAYTGQRAAVIMKQVGLNVAADSLLSAAYTGVKGGFVIIAADDPGPHSSQTEQDSRLFALFAKIPAFDPADPIEALQMVAPAFALSEQYEIPVLLRPAIRVCHSRMPVPLSTPLDLERSANFVKDPQRWAATPRYRLQLHIALNEKLARMATELAQRGELNYQVNSTQGSSLGIIAAGVCYATLQDLLAAQDASGQYDVLKLGTVYPLPHPLVTDFIQAHEQVLVLEEPDAAIELQLSDRRKVHGRLDGWVPAAGELTPEVIHRILARWHPGIDLTGQEQWQQELQQALPPVVSRRPTLCPGCGHRACFFALRKALPKAIFTSDIGCYTLGINLQAVDTVLAMGAGLTMANGLYQAYKRTGTVPPIVATMGDSTFFHSGVSGLVDGVYSKARYIFVLLDNATTAMTGAQPTPDSGLLADGCQGQQVDLVELIKGCGISYLKIVDPYHVAEMIEVTRAAYAYTQQSDGGIAVIVARHPCIMAYRRTLSRPAGRVVIKEECTGCGYCVQRFECPALVYQPDQKRVTIDPKLCCDCGVCIAACPQDMIYRLEE